MGLRRSEYALYQQGAKKHAVCNYLLSSIVVSDQHEGVCLGKKLLLTVNERYLKLRELF